MIHTYIIVNEDDTFYSQKFEEGTQPESAIKYNYVGTYIVPKYNKITNECYEGASSELLEEKAVQIDREYTHNLIPFVMQKHLQKQAYTPSYEIPIEVLNEVDRLKAECNDKITETTGLTDFSYRSNYPDLM